MLLQAEAGMHDQLFDDVSKHVDVHMDATVGRKRPFEVALAEPVGGLPKVGAPLLFKVGAPLLFTSGSAMMVQPQKVVNPAYILALLSLIGYLILEKRVMQWNFLLLLNMLG